MRERNLPKSFWNPAEKMPPQQVQLEHAQSLLALPNQQHNSGAPFLNRVRYGSCNTPNTSCGPNRTCPQQWQQTISHSNYDVQRPYAANPGLNLGCYRMPAPARFAGNVRPASEIMPGATCFYGPRIGCGFNPRYNSLLVYPEVKPQLPRIPGEPRSS